MVVNNPILHTGCESTRMLGLAAAVHIEHSFDYWKEFRFKSVQHSVAMSPSLVGMAYTYI